jgi:DNA (cytosine-5)-methyltransferase 1
MATKLTVASVFCGCGGLDHGFAHKEGFEISFAADLDPISVVNYNLNFAHKAVQLDVTCVTRVCADVLLGGPPCQDFSSAGKQVAGPRADLSVTYAQLICTSLPRYFVFENVPAMRTTGKTHFDKVVAMLRGAGYGLTIRVADMEDYGVPETRKRLLILGFRYGLDGWADAALDAVKIPERTTMRDVLTLGGFLSPTDPRTAAYYYVHEGRRAIHNLDGPHPTLTTAHPCSTPPPNYHLKFHHLDHTRNLDEVAHLDHLARACVHSFPSDYVWGFSRCRCIKMVGNSVPPRFSAVLASVIHEHWHANSLQA